MKEQDKPKIISAVLMLLDAIEGKPLRKELLETPNRVQRAFEELFDGYNTDIDALFKTFDGEGKDQIVAVKDIKFTSTCEHHLMLFSGVAHVAYLPKGKAIGASKIPRLVLAYAHRLQIQERITEQVANTLMEKLQPQGVAVIIQGEHACMRCRGVRSEESKLVTSVMLGLFRDDAVTKQEVLALLGLVR